MIIMDWRSLHLTDLLHNVQVLSFEQIQAPSTFCLISVDVKSMLFVT